MLRSVRMSRVSARDLRNHTREVLERARRGEVVEITVNRQAVAELRPLPPRPSWVPGTTLQEVLREAPADPGLADDLAPFREQTIEPR